MEKQPLFSLPELFAVTADEDIELVTGKHEFPLSQAKGDKFIQCLSFEGQYPSRVVLTAYGETSFVSTMFTRLPNGLYRVDKAWPGVYADEVFDRHDKHVAKLAEKAFAGQMFKLGTVAHVRGLS